MIKLWPSRPAFPHQLGDGVLPWCYASFEFVGDSSGSTRARAGRTHEFSTCDEHTALGLRREARYSISKSYAGLYSNNTHSTAFFFIEKRNGTTLFF